MMSRLPTVVVKIGEPCMLFCFEFCSERAFEFTGIFAS